MQILRENSFRDNTPWALRHCKSESCPSSTRRWSFERKSFSLQERNRFSNAWEPTGSQSHCHWPLVCKQESLLCSLGIWDEVGFCAGQLSSLCLSGSPALKSSGSWLLGAATVISSAKAQIAAVPSRVKIITGWCQSPDNPKSEKPGAKGVSLWHNCAWRKQFKGAFFNQIPSHNILFQLSHSFSRCWRAQLFQSFYEMFAFREPKAFATSSCIA